MFKNGMTNGIDHIQRSRKEKKRKRDEKERVNLCNLGKGGSYYRPCYRKRSNIKEGYSQRRRDCSSSRLGCKECEEFFCAQCWKSYDHNS